jgi:hypothetical protein
MERSRRGGPVQGRDAPGREPDTLGRRHVGHGPVAVAGVDPETLPNDLLSGQSNIKIWKLNDNIMRVIA